MSTESLITVLIAVLSSSLVAALITAVFSLYAKKKDYENDYFKEVIRRRLAAYEVVEVQIAMLKTSVIDDDGRAYHLLFGGFEDEYAQFLKNLMVAVSTSMWLTNETTRHLIELNRLFLGIEIDPDDHDSLIEVGKRKYVEIAEIRQKLEPAFRSDILQIHKVKKFLKQRGVEEGFQKVNVERIRRENL